MVKYTEGINISEIPYSRLIQMIGKIRNTENDMGAYCGAVIKARGDIILVEVEFENGVYQATNNDYEKIK